jgi:pimeloyl-ACP methyl ester carboxylesterase
MHPFLVRCASVVAAAMLLQGGDRRSANAAALRQSTVPSTSGTRLSGLVTGGHGVGFTTRRASRPDHATSQTPDTSRSLAVWYPAARAPLTGTRISSLEYRLEQFAHALTAADRAQYARQEAEVMVQSRHVGIVALTTSQAHAALLTTGIAVRNAPYATGRFPVVLLFGGPYYLATTAEYLASHGFVVAAPYRLQDFGQPPPDMKWTVQMDRSVNDGTWAVQTLRTFAAADTRFVSAIGHGGGGLAALLYAMRHQDTAALLNLDAGNFSTRTSAGELPAYRPGHVRIPYLYIATSSTREQQDRFDDFLGMHRSVRFEVTLTAPDLRHHDLSDLGRAVTSPLNIREDNGAVQAVYVYAHEMMLQFLEAFGRRAQSGESRFDAWLATASSNGRKVVKHAATN